MKKITVIGGGTGSYVLLRGLKQLPVEITAVVNMFDSGRSTGMLRDEFGILPPGDARQNLVALAAEGKENILRELFSFRFKEDSSLHGHNFGNLFITALSEILGSDVEAIRKAGEILNIKGRVLPVTTDLAHLYAELEDGQIIRGEANIDIPKHNGALKIKRVYLAPQARLFREARAAILGADMVVIGPGDLYSSLIPNLLVQGMKETLGKSKAKVVYVCNIMTKWGETHGFNAGACSRELLRYTGKKEFDAIVCSRVRLGPYLARAYRREKKFPMRIDDAVRDLAKRVIVDDLHVTRGVVRHDSDALARSISSLLG